MNIGILSAHFYEKVYALRDFESHLRLTPPRKEPHQAPFQP